MIDRSSGSENQPRSASPGSRVIFWSSVGAWIGFCILTLLLVPLLELLQPSVHLGLLISIVIPIALVFSANVAAIYPAFISKAIRTEPLEKLAWLASIGIAALADIALIWGTIRLAVFGPGPP